MRISFILGFKMAWLLAGTLSGAGVEGGVSYTARLYAQGEKLAPGDPPTFSCDDEIHL